MNILVLHGPNLNLLGERVGDDGSVTLAGIDALLRERADELGASLIIVQSNHEGALVDALHSQRRWAEAVIVSPDALAQNGWVLRTALANLGRLTVEVHLGPRRTSVIKPACVAQLQKKGVNGYLLALDGLVSGKWDKKRKGKGKVKELPPRKAPQSVLAPVVRTAAPKPVLTPKPTVGSKPAVAPKEAPPPRPTPKMGARVDPMRPEKTLGRVAAAPSSSPRPPARRPDTMPKGLSRALVRMKISDRLAGKLSPAGLATWARAQWLEVQRGAPAESGQRETLEDALQALTNSGFPGKHMSDDELITLMSQLET
jgi:3-dehydroquinate dehydratase-2